jgi:hypothetical protein
MLDHRSIPILLMADYLADPLWHRTAEGTSMISLDALPLSQG